MVEARRPSCAITTHGGLRDQQDPTGTHRHPPGSNRNRDRPHIASLHFAACPITPPAYHPLPLTSCRLFLYFCNSQSLELGRPTGATHYMAQGFPIPNIPGSKLPPPPLVGGSHHNQPPDTAESAGAESARTVSHTSPDLHHPTSATNPGNTRQEENLTER